MLAVAALIAAGGAAVGQEADVSTNSELVGPIASNQLKYYCFYGNKAFSPGTLFCPAKSFDAMFRGWSGDR